jgi:uncharacterized membrane protein YphA (DoxX/SURF4 family)
LGYEVLRADDRKHVHARASTTLVPYALRAGRPRRLEQGEQDVLAAYAEPDGPVPRAGAGRAGGGQQSRESGSKTHTYECAVRFDDLDSYGHVNNVVFAEYVQEARIDFAVRHFQDAFSPAEGFVGHIGGLGFPVPEAFAWMSGFAEFGGGLLLAIGLLTRPAALLVAVHFVIVTFLAHAGDPFGRRELPLFFLVAALLFVFTGAGRYSADAAVQGRQTR